MSDPKTWTDFETAKAAALRLGVGIGFMLTKDDPYTVIDVDIKADASAADIARADRIADAFDTYIERSQSGRGLHIWAIGKIGKGRRRDGVEIYCQDRFMICTGDVMKDTAISRCDDSLSQLLSEMDEPAPHLDVDLDGDDSTDWSLAHRAVQDDGELGRLFRGEWEGEYPSQSEADLALVCLLLPLTESARECWNTFRLSVLGKRPKAGRADYARSTIGAAAQRVRLDRVQLNHGAEIAAALLGSMNQPSIQSELAPTDFHASQGLLTARIVDWRTEDDVEVPDIVEGLVADEEVTLLGGHGGVGKSFMALQMSCAVALGTDFLGHEVQESKVLYYSAEDGRKRLTRRLRKAAETFGYDVDKLFSNLRVIDASELEPLYGESETQTAGSKRFRSVLGPRADYENLRKMVFAFDPQLVVIDGASDTFDGNEIARREVRAFIKMLRAINPTRRIGVLLLVHIDRASARGHVSNDEGYSGSGQWHNSARRRIYLQLKVERDEDQNAVSETLLLRVMKNQDGPPDPDVELTRGAHGLWQQVAQFSTSVVSISEQRELLLRLMAEFSDRGGNISTSLAPQATTGVYAMLRADPHFPRSLRRKQTADLVGQLERDGLLIREEYKRSNRTTAERWRVKL